MNRARSDDDTTQREARPRKVSAPALQALTHSRQALRDAVDDPSLAVALDLVINENIDCICAEETAASARKIAAIRDQLLATEAQLSATKAQLFVTEAQRDRLLDRLGKIER